MQQDVFAETELINVISKAEKAPRVGSDSGLKQLLYHHMPPHHFPRAIFSRPTKLQFQ